VLLLFAGKAHPNDEPGKQLIRDIMTISKRTEFRGKVVLLENYNLSLARQLCSGVDVWLNVPEYPKEACGTSGMKAAMNGRASVFKNMTPISAVIVPMIKYGIKVM